ncbi:MAG TPA: hypothetical protein VGI45_24480 [Terracidiphilus sp.]|jgi:hypothetical protein
MKAEQGNISDPVAISDTSFFDREVSWLRMDGQRARWIVWAFLSALVVYLVVVGKLATGPVNVFHPDALAFLDDGWRVLHGQVPHRDFYSPLGPLEFWMIAAGMLFAHGGTQGIAISIAAFGFLTGTWGWFLARRRMLPLFALLITGWLVLTAASPTPLGFDPRFLSCAMIYNRQGYALLGIILVECAFSQERSRFWGGVSSGVALVLLAFLKLNFFGVAGLVLLTSVPLTRTELRRLWGFLTGATMTLIGFVLYPGFSISAFYSDMSFVKQARGSVLSLAGTLHGIGTCAKSGSVWLVVAMTVAAVVMIAPRERRRREFWTLTLLSLVVLASGPFFLQTNSMENSCQLASLWIIILVERMTAIHPRMKEKSVTVVLIALSLGAVAASMASDSASALSLISFEPATEEASASRIAAPGMERLLFYNTNTVYDSDRKGGDGDGSYYVDAVNDGLALLNQQSTPQESILVLGFQNPFTYLLRRKPAEGGSAFLDVGKSISSTHMPAVDRVFGNADLMMLPDYDSSHRASDLFVENYYHAYLLENFQLVGRSQRWLLYRRNE